MVDTIKILIPIDDPSILSKGKFRPLSIRDVVYGRGFRATALNEQKAYAKKGIYMPRLTFFKRAKANGAPLYELAVEFSAPKLILGNNLEEITSLTFLR